jgi:putative glutamine amidotransferase
MERMKKIGVPSAFMHPSHERNSLGKKRLCFYSNDMGTYLARKNVMPILIPDLPEKALHNFLDQRATMQHPLIQINGLAIT